MIDLAPDIVRQRLLIEGIYEISVTEEVVKAFLVDLADTLNLRHYGEPTIHSPEGMGKESNEGFDAFLPLIDSGISLYVWTSSNFFASVLFTCKEFNSDKAISFTKNYFKTKKLEYKEF